MDIKIHYSEGVEEKIKEFNKILRDYEKAFSADMDRRGLKRRCDRMYWESIHSKKKAIEKEIEKLKANSIAEGIEIIED